MFSRRTISISRLITGVPEARLKTERRRDDIPIE
jgi:hypothetical protein